jgi:hypothetical protein
MAYVEIGSSIVTEHKEAGLVKQRTKRKNHLSTSVDLLNVPRYSDLLEDMDAEEESDRGRALVTTEAGWRTEMAKWIGDTRAEAEDTSSDSDNDSPAAVPTRIQAPKRMTLSTLFGGQVRRPPRLAQINEEEVLMEALAEQLEDDRLDDGAIEVDGDEYEP